MKKIVSMTASHRPSYTQRVIDSFFHCYNVSQYKLVVFVEPVSDQVINIFKNIDFCEVELNVNKKRLGHTLNAYESLRRGFELSDYVIRIEDDTLLAKDFLKFHEFCYEKFKDDIDSVFSVSAGHYSEPNTVYSPEEVNKVVQRSSFSNQGWATWLDRWLEPQGAAEVWENPETISDRQYIINYKYGGWDGLLHNIHRKNRNELVPIVSRVKNIGALNGVHYVSPEHHEQNIEVSDWAGNYELDEHITYNLQ